MTPPLLFRFGVSVALVAIVAQTVTSNERVKVAQRWLAVAGIALALAVSLWEVAP